MTPTKSTCPDVSGRSVGSSGGIFRELGTSAHTVPDSLGARGSRTLLHHRWWRKSSTLQKENQHVLLGKYIGDALMCF